MACSFGFSFYTTVYHDNCNLEKTFWSLMGFRILCECPLKLSLFQLLQHSIRKLVPSSVKSLPPMVLLYLYKSTVVPFMEFYSYILAVSPKFYLDLLGRLQLQLQRAFGPEIITSLTTWKIFIQISLICFPSSPFLAIYTIFF